MVNMANAYRVTGHLRHALSDWCGVLTEAEQLQIETILKTVQTRMREENARRHPEHDSDPIYAFLHEEQRLRDAG